MELGWKKHPSGHYELISDNYACWVENGGGRYGGRCCATIHCRLGGTYTRRLLPSVARGTEFCERIIAEDKAKRAKLTEEGGIPVFLVLQGDINMGYSVEQVFATRALAQEYAETAQQQDPLDRFHYRDSHEEYHVAPYVIRTANPFRLVTTWSVEVDIETGKTTYAKPRKHLSSAETFRWGYVSSFTPGTGSGWGVSSVSSDDALLLARGALRGEEVSEGVEGVKGVEDRELHEESDDPAFSDWLFEEPDENGMCYLG